MSVEDWLIGELKEKKGLSDDKIDTMIKEKQNQFPSLNREAAIRMIATQNGITPVKRNFKINEIAEESSHINVSGRVKRKFEPRAIKIKGREGRVMNLNLEDETGNINLVVWDEKVIDYINSGVSEGDEVSIANAYSKKNKLTGSLELHVGSGTAISVTNKSSNRQENIKYDKIKDITEENKIYHLKGFIARLFTNDIYLVRCTECNKKVNVTCDVHGDKFLSKTLLITGIIDDGVSSMKISFFDKTAEKLLSLSKSNTIEEKLNDLSFGLYQVEIAATARKFNDVFSLTARDIKPLTYNMDKI
jgi:ssDNA-binding replication factor A large subunit